MELKIYLAKKRGRAAKLAADIGVSQVTIHQWAGFNPFNKKRVPTDRCASIEQATAGAVTRKDLRPDDWHLIWPELIEDKAA